MSYTSCSAVVASSWALFFGGSVTDDHEVLSVVVSQIVVDRGVLEGLLEGGDVHEEDTIVFRR